MLRHLKCRRTFVALVAIGCLTWIGIVNTTDVSMAIASVAIGLAGANSYQKAQQSRNDKGGGVP